MKKNELNEIKKTENSILRTKIKDAKKELVNLQFDKENKKLKDLKVVYKKRKDIAQMLTILRQKELLESLETRVKSLESSEEVKTENTKSKNTGKKTKVTKKEEKI